MLEAVDDCNPWEDTEDTYELVAFGACGLFFIIIKHVVMIAAEELHTHGSDFTEFNGCRTDEHVRDVTRGLIVESMSAFMEHGIDITLCAGRVHEDEGLLGMFE